MPLEISASLLAKLRAHRATRHADHQTGHSAGSSKPRDKATSFLDRVARAFGHEDPSNVAEEYVSAMAAWQDEVEAEYDAFLLDPGMGPMIYLTADGRMLEDLRAWDGDDVRELEGEQIFIALVVGAKKTGIVELLDLLPPAPGHSATCPKCSGTHWSRPGPGFDHEFPCLECHALGWIRAEVEESSVD